MIIPANLQLGDTVAIVSPSGAIDTKQLDDAIATIKSWGLNVVIGQHATGKHFMFSGTDTERLADLQQAFDNSDIKAIFCSRGGYGAVRIADKIDLRGITAHPKWVVGFSDITILHSLLNRNNIVSVHGPMPKNFAAHLLQPDDSSLEQLKKLLFTGKVNYRWNGLCNKSESIVTGELVGGNLSVLTGLRGTLLEPYYHGKILFIEDLNEHLYHIDRMVNNLRLGGVFNRVKALIIGGFTDMKDSETTFGSNLNDLITAATSEAGIPVYYNFPAGHQTPNYPLPFGQVITVEHDSQGCKLHN
jgi:muramoyltetrapeptide carboxypeptidase